MSFEAGTGHPLSVTCFLDAVSTKRAFATAAAAFTPAVRPGREHDKENPGPKPFPRTHTRTKLNASNFKVKRVSLQSETRFSCK